MGAETAGREAFVRQLAWRDWWAHTLARRPELPDVALKARYDDIIWRDDPDGFERWCHGRTGFPIVDAGMRQLTGTGWMHNRVRMICASFLVKDLLIDWRKGERFFRHHLVDADVAQNAGNWQWVAGTGPDAAPYFRIFNPTSQATKFDPRGEYVRRWVPELGALPTTIIHEPHLADPDLLAAAGIILGETYPQPIVDHRDASPHAGCVQGSARPRSATVTRTGAAGGSDRSTDVVRSPMRRRPHVALPYATRRRRAAALLRSGLTPTFPVPFLP